MNTTNTNTKKYYICGGRDAHWTPVNSATLRGAKAIASRTYQPSVGGKIEVAENHGERGGFVVVAVKYGYDKWQDA